MFAMLRTIAGELPTLADHAEAYAELAADELASATRQWSRRMAAFAVSAVAGLLAVGFGGVALMLWGALPEAAMPRAAWLLWACPLAFAVLSAVSAWMAFGLPRERAFAELRAQWRQDLALVRGDASP